MNKVLRTALLFCLACVSMFASAQTFADGGEYYFKTTYAGQDYYFGPTNNWGTRAGLVEHSVPWVLHYKSENVYSLESIVNNGGTSYWFTGTYCDGGETNVYFTVQSDGSYLLSTAPDASYLRVAEAAGSANRPAVDNGGDAAAALKWTVVACDAASIKQYDDISFLIKDANFDRNNRYQSAWIVTASNKNLSGGQDMNRNAESWRSAFEIKQSIAGLPDGYYTMTVQAAVQDYAGLFDGANYPVAYLNDAEVPFNDHNAEHRGKSMSDFSGYFSSGAYVLTVPAKVTGGTITLGVKGTRTDTWCIFDNFGLKYMGDDATDYDKPAYEEILAAYNEVKAALEAAQATIAGYDAYTQNQVATEKATVEGDFETLTTDFNAAHEALTCVDNKATLLATIATLTTDIETLAANAKAVNDGYLTLVADFDAAETTWRDATKEITELDAKYGNEINTPAVLDKMNEANSLLKGVKDAIADGSVVIADANTDIAAALALIAEAKSLAQANVKEYLALPAGEYYLKTTYDGKDFFLGGANNWGTHAALIPNSVLWNLEKVEAGVYRLDSYQSNGGGNHYLGSNSFIDAGAVNIYFTEQGEGTGVYTLSLAADAQYLAVEAMGCHNLPNLNWAGDATAALKFKVVAKDAEIQKYDDVTYLLRNANFDTNNRWGGHRDYAQAWTMEADNQNLRGGEAPNTCAESWHSAFTLSQTIEGVPNGYYTMTVQAAVRDDSEAAQAAYNAGAATFAIADAPVAYINEATAPFIEMENVKYENYTIYRWSAETYTSTFTPALNGSANMYGFSQMFAEGKYKLTIPVEVKDNKITLGVKGTRTDTWCIFDNFTLKFMGDDATDVNEIPYADLNAAYDEAKAKFDAAKAEVAAYDDFVKTAVAGDETAITKKLDEAKAAIEKAHTDIKCAEQKETILASIAEINAATEAYAEKAKNLQEGNDNAYAKMDEAYAALVEKWQSAYDKINTEYKEYLNSNAEAYDGYLKQLNSLWVDIDALDATIDGYKAAGTAEKNEAATLELIAKDAENVDNILATALNNYNDEVCVANQKAYEAVTKKADAITAAYKEAIVKVSEHYAQFHSEAAADAQVALFDIYQKVQTVKSNATTAYTNIEASNKVKFDAEDLPLADFINTAYLADLDINSEAAINDIMADVEAAAAAESKAQADELIAKFEAQKTALAQAEDLIAAYGLDAAEYADALKSINDHFVATRSALYPTAQMTFTRRNGNYGNGVILEWAVCGSNDAAAPESAWTKLATFETPEGEETVFTRDFVAENYKYLRFYFVKNKANSIFGHMSEFQVLLNGEELITNNAQLTSPCGDSSEGQHIEYLLDGDINTMWHSDWHGAYTAGAHYVQVELVEPIGANAHSENFCGVEDAEAVNAEIEAVKAEIEALVNTVKGDRSDDLLAAIKTKADAAKEALAAALPETYEDAVKTKFADKVAEITKKIEDVVTEATAADEAGTLITKFGALDAKLGESTDVYSDVNVIAVTMAKGTGTSYDDGTVNGKFCIKVGTSSKTGSAHIVVPAGVKTVTFNAAAWKGIADLVLTITDGSANPAKNITIHGNDGATSNSPFTIDEAGTSYTYTFDALTTAEVTLDLAADKRFIIWNAQGSDGAAAVNSAYAEINNLAVQAENENYYVLDQALIAALKDSYNAAKNVIAGIGADKATELAVINGEISAVNTKVKNAYEAVELAAKDTEIADDVATVQEHIDALLANVYQADLQQKIGDVKATWNVEYAKEKEHMTADQKALYDEIYAKIETLANEIDATTDYTAETYAEDKAAIADLALFFEDYSQWVKDNYILGDANLDSDVTVSDAVLAVSFALESATPNERQQYTADANEDGTITVTDAVSIIDIALGVEPEAGVKGIDAAVASNDYLVVNGTEISLVNEMSYRGFQMDIAAEGNVDIELSERAAGFIVSKNKLANGATRVIVMSLNRDVIEAQEGVLFTVKGAKDITISNVEFTGTDKVAYELGVQVVTGINGINADFAGESIYTLGGARVSKVQKGGVYIINGKKMLVK
ncbi:MAG: hypothetical protein J6I36_09145 [Bacteroidaceae bacterium]|nr:hypothetical protein [Bacteroidaceae bacterium]